MPRSKPRRSPLRSLVRTVLLMPFWAVPFALFFWVVRGGGLPRLVGAYQVSLVFAMTIGLTLWAVEHFVQPRLDRAIGPKRRTILYYGGLYGGAATLASYAAAVVLHFTMLPGFLGGVRAFAAMTMYTLVFVCVVTGIIFMISYHKESLDRVRSEEEMNLARRIQRSFLLSHFPAMPRLEVHAANISSKQVSGDFYDVVPAGPDSFLIAIADVAGKGVPAALLSSVLQASLRTQATSTPSVAGMLKNINALVYRSTAVDQFATFFLARVDETSLRMTYANAGHNYPVVFRANGEQMLLDRGGVVLGVLEDTYFEEGTVQLRPGDRVLLYSDGISEAFDARGELYGEERLYEAFATLPDDLRAEEVVARVFDAVHAYMGNAEQKDDMTLLVLRVLEPAAARSGERVPVAAASAPGATRAGSVTSGAGA